MVKNELERYKLCKTELKIFRMPDGKKTIMSLKLTNEIGNVV
ncbi:hypothetical protein THOM_3081 [Trachipleistophora hominis]|uniref:Uncharacterized protein n=1 Tax=Trachipleistophora hominis TaxID=72359 RepID=L7JR89_TRAHO|nr:hypothetical protein THOM_3081 [Trachipleistophora hominis]